MKRVLLTMALLGFASGAVAKDLNLQEELGRPGVRLVAVEFYATWCKPCMEAMPRWKKLKEKYHEQGLRVVVVNTLDPDAGCSSIGFVPDANICDLDGALADRFQLNGKLPSAFLWSWQGNLLVKKGHIDEVESAVESYLIKAPRVVVEGAKGSSDSLLSLIRGALTNSSKITVVATDAERKALLARKRKQQSSMSIDATQACEMGQEVPANAVLKAAIVGKGKNRFLNLSLTDITKGCQLQSASVSWSKNQKTMANEVVSKLLSHLKRNRVQMPGTATEVFRRPTATVSAESSTKLFVEVSPRKARLFLDNRPLSKSAMKPFEGGVLINVEPGKKYTIGAQAQGYQAREQAVFARRGQIARAVLDLPRTQKKTDAGCTGEACLADVTIQSNPADAEIWIDGQRQDELTTPTIGDPNVGAANLRIMAGERIIEVRKAQYERARITMKVTPGGFQKTKVLTLKPNFGALVVKSKPAGAVVRLDGKTQAGKTPLVIERTEAGPHNIELELADHYPVQQVISVGQGGTTEKTFRLKPNFGAIEVSVRHKGAPTDGVLVEVVGLKKQRSGGGLVRFERVPSGPQVVRIRDPLYAGKTWRIEVKDGTTKTLDARLDAQYAWLTVNVTGDVPGRVLVGDRPMARAKAQQMPAGEVTVRFEPNNPDRYAPASAKAVLDILERKTITIAPKARTGQLTVITKPMGANVVIGGEDRGTSPLRVDLFAGRHELVVTAPGFDPTRQTVTIEEGKTQRHEVFLGQKPTIFARCNRKGGQIIFNGKPRGPAPQTIVTTPGKHTLRCEFDGAHAQKRVTLADGHRLEVDLIITDDVLGAAYTKANQAKKDRAWTFTYAGGGAVVAGIGAIVLALSTQSDADAKFEEANAQSSAAPAQSLKAEGDNLEASAGTWQVTGMVLSAIGAAALGYGIYSLKQTSTPKASGSTPPTDAKPTPKAGWQWHLTGMEYQW